MIPKMPPREGQLGFLYLPPYRIQGVSVAGEQTVIQIPEIDLYPTWACTRFTQRGNPGAQHAYMDHVGGIPYWLSQRHFKLGQGHVVVTPISSNHSIA